MRRLSRVEGQVRGVRGMVSEEAYCIDVLTQIAAATKALDGVAVQLPSPTTRPTAFAMRSLRAGPRPTRRSPS